MKLRFKGLTPCQLAGHCQTNLAVGQIVQLVEGDIFDPNSWLQVDGGIGFLYHAINFDVLPTRSSHLPDFL